MWTPTSTAGRATARSAPPSRSRAGRSASREELEARFRRFAEEHPGEVPRPADWCGFCLHAEQIEFWINGEDRLHDRFLFTRESGAWNRTRLYP